MCWFDSSPVSVEFEVFLIVDVDCTKGVCLEWKTWCNIICTYVIGTTGAHLALLNGWALYGACVLLALTYKCGPDQLT